VKRIVLSFIYCLILHTAFAQDTVPPRPDTAGKIQQPVRDTTQRRVIVPRRRDTVRRAADSLRIIALATADTLRSPLDSLQKPVTASGPDIAGALKGMMRQHPYFSFFAKPVNLIAITRKVPDRDLYFYVLLGLFFYFAMVRTLFRKYINNMVSIFLRITLRQQQLREQLLQSPFPSMMLNIFFVLVGGFYASLLLEYYKFHAHPNFWIQTLYCVAILALIYVGKFVILKFTGWVFNLSKATDTYIFIVFLVNKMLGILLLPFLVLIAFYSGQAQQVFVTLSLILIVVLFAYRFIFSFGPIRAEIKVNPFHFFLYLCAFEIAPLLLIYKVLLSVLN
jgi:hypothetical protein